MYRAGDGQCICENGVIWSDNGTCEVVKKSTTVKSSTVVNTSISNDQQCNQKYPGTVYRASDDRCICSN